MHLIYDINLLSRVLENLPLPLGIANKKGQILYYNKAFTNTYGYTLKDTPTAKEFMQTLFISKAYAKEQFLLWQNAIKKAKQQGDINSVHVESKFLCKDGSMKAIRSQTTVTEELYIVICEDITKEKIAVKNPHNGFMRTPVTKCYTLKALIAHHRIVEKGDHLFLFDLDKVYAYEEEVGKLRATELIKKFATFLQQNTREENDIYHYDNNTFALIVTTSSKGAQILIQRLQEEWKKTVIPLCAGKYISFCTGAVTVESTQSLENAILKATEALHQAQWEGSGTLKILQL